MQEAPLRITTDSAPPSAEASFARSTSLIKHVMRHPNLGKEKYRQPYHGQAF